MTTTYSYFVDKIQGYKTITETRAFTAPTDDDIHMDNVGIGTTTPDAHLHIVGTQNNLVKLHRPSGNAYQLFTNDAAVAGTEIGVDSGGGFHIRSKDAKTMHFHTSDTERMTIKYGGNVGIGNSNPLYNLDITGDLNYTGDLKKDGTTLSLGGEWTKTSNDIYFLNNVGVGLNNPSYDLDVTGDINYTGDLKKDGVTQTLGGAGKIPPTGGNVYPTPNTNTPTGIYNTHLGLESGFAVNSTYTGSYNTGYGGGTLKYCTSGYHNTAVGSFSLSTLTTGYQNTALGITSLYNLTTGNMNTALGADTGWGSSNTLEKCVFLGYKAGWGATDTNSFYLANSEGSTDILMHGDFEYQRLAIGTDTIDTSYTLTVGGNVTCTSLNESSDSRIKQNIENENCSDIYNKFYQLEVKKYDYTEDWCKHNKFQNEVVSGLIAQQVKYVFPDCVNVGEKTISYVSKTSKGNPKEDEYEPEEITSRTIDDFHSININKLMIKMIATIKQLQEEIKLLKNK